MFRRRRYTIRLDAGCAKPALGAQARHDGIDKNVIPVITGIQFINAAQSGTLLLSVAE